MSNDITEDLMQKLRSALKNNPRAINILKRYLSDKVLIVWKTEDVHIRIIFYEYQTALLGIIANHGHLPNNRKLRLL
jgi:hypothetical protein